MNMHSYVLAKPNKCIGCKACEVACAVAHLEVGVSAAGTMNTPFQPRLSVIRTHQVTMPIQCRHCNDAPCANACPVKVITEQEGHIVIHTENCIGCKTCMLACPFGAIDMVMNLEQGEVILQAGIKKEKLVAHKCDLCAARPNSPACVEVCPADALMLVKPDVMRSTLKKKRIASATNIAKAKRNGLVEAL